MVFPFFISKYIFIGSAAVKKINAFAERLLNRRSKLVQYWALGNCKLGKYVCFQSLFSLPGGVRKKYVVPQSAMDEFLSSAGVAAFPQEGGMDETAVVQIKYITAQKSPPPFFKGKKRRSFVAFFCRTPSSCAPTAAPGWRRIRRPIPRVATDSPWWEIMLSSHKNIILGFRFGCFFG